MNESVQVEVLVKICNRLGCTMGDICLSQRRGFYE